ncbi:MAG: tRNA epoxyqueuosine(34) reductase QueG [Gammaproteobacteria bacterium]|nr:tRNA epoxyqueuosine(34) reductase QueG [Gammaproteobacteria bacterium]
MAGIISVMRPTQNHFDTTQLLDQIHRWGEELGFSQLGVSGVSLDAAEAALNRWLAQGYHGEMGYMAHHGTKRSRPAELEPGTLSVISVRMAYLPESMAQAITTLEDGRRGYVSRYALGRDYHKMMRKRLQQLAHRITDEIGEFGYRVFVDSAPVLEKPLAQQAGLGWVGKHSMVLCREAGSWFFLGEIYTTLPLPATTPVEAHCGRCSACIDICPTAAIVEPYVVDARRCISYLTIEHKGAIPLALRPLIGNRIYGCDDCQLACPWNRFATLTAQADFLPRHHLDHSSLVELLAWDEATFLHNTEGSAIRRIGHEAWQRNIAVAMGNAPYDSAIVEALQRQQTHPSALVAEHIEWAVGRQDAAREAHGKG